MSQYIGRRTSFVLSEQLIRGLDLASFELGLSRSEYVRRALEAAVAGQTVTAGPVRIQSDADGTQVAVNRPRDGRSQAVNRSGRLTTRSDAELQRRYDRVKKEGEKVKQMLGGKVVLVTPGKPHFRVVRDK